MATSDHWQIPHVVSIIKEVNPEAVLDVGCGWGKYGLLAREYSRATRVDCIDMYPPRYPVYDHAYQGNIREIERVLPTDAPRYDLAMVIEVIEHLEKPAGLELLAKLKRLARFVLVTTPIGFRVQEIPDMPYERHRSGWFPWEFRRVGQRLHSEIYPGHYTRKLHLPSHWQQLHLFGEGSLPR